MKKKHPGGRPSKYKPEYCEEIIEFFSVEPYREVEVTHRNKKGEEWTTSELRANKLPFFSAFARKINVDDDTLGRWCEAYPEFCGAYKKCKSLQKEFMIHNAISGLYNPASFIFTAKNITDMRDKQEVEHSGSVNVTSRTAHMTQEELEKFVSDFRKTKS